MKVLYRIGIAACAILIAYNAYTSVNMFNGENLKLSDLKLLAFAQWEDGSDDPIWEEDVYWDTNGICARYTPFEGMEVYEECECDVITVRCYPDGNEACYASQDVSWGSCETKGLC